MTSSLSWQQYTDEKALSKLLTDAAQACFEKQVANPSSFLASYFKRRVSSDVVEAISVEEQLDGNGGFTVGVRLSLSSGVVAASCASHSVLLAVQHPTSSRKVTLSTALAAAGEKTPKHIPAQRYGASVAFLQQRVVPQLRGLAVASQRAFDEQLQTLDGTVGFSNVLAQVAACISINCAKAAAAALNTSLVHHLATQFYDDTIQPPAFFIPTPIITIFSSEPKSMGRVRVREVCVIPKSTKNLAATFAKVSSVAEAVQAKLEDAFVTNADGAVKYNLYESLAQAVDFIEDLVKESGSVTGSDFAIGIVLDAALCFKPETQKYSLTEGQELSGAQLAEQLAQLTRDKKNVAYLEDTHHENDVTEMRRLMARVGATIVLAGNNTYAGNVTAAQRGVRELLTNNAVIRLNDCGSVTNAMHFARAFSEYRGATLTVACETVEGNGAFLADFATAIGATYLRVGGVFRSEHAAILNRIVSLQHELESRAMLCSAPELPAIALPPAPTEPVVEIATKPDKKKK